MDQLTSDLLTNWGLGDYVGAFCDGRVDAGILRLLADDEISQLIPVPGDRARFKVNLANWKQQIDNLHTPEPCPTSTPNLPTLSLSGCSEPGSEASSIGALLSDFITCPPQSEKVFIDLTSSHKTSSSGPDQTSQEAQSSQQGSSALPVQTAYDDWQISGYVLRTLESTLDGKSILTQGKSVGKLDETQRNLLVKLLISPLFEKDSTRQFTNEQLLDWSLQIQEIFPKESSALYYTPYVAANVRNLARNASGKLLRFVYNKRRQLRERGIIPSSSRSRSRSASSTSTVNSPVAYLTNNQSSEEISEKLTWLKSSVDPWHVVEENWMATANYRLQSIYEGPGGTVQEYFNEYPVLKRPTGYNLLLKDFDCLYPDKGDGLFINIVNLRDKIIALTKKKASTIRDKDVKLNINKYLSIATCESPSPDALNNASLLLLPYLTSSVPVKDKNKSLWRPSKSEIRDGFITQLASDSELETTIASRKSKLLRYGKTLQPFVVFVGPNINEISHCYVVAGDTCYTFEKLVNAVDACFKVIHATGSKYQEESFVVWMVIQKGFYKVNTVYDKELTTVSSLFVDLELS